MAKWGNYFCITVMRFSVLLRSVKFTIISKSWTSLYQSQRDCGSQHSITAPILTHHASGKMGQVIFAIQTSTHFPHGNRNLKSYENLERSNIKV